MERAIRYLALHLPGIIVPVLGALFWTMPAGAQSLEQLLGGADANLLTNGGFEAPKPAYWDATGAGAEWTTEVSRTPRYSLKLSGAGVAEWAQDEAVRNWVARIKGNQEIIVGGWVRTEGVNTNPATDAEKYQLVFEFKDANGTDLLGEPLVLDLPQAQASSGGWVQLDSRQVGPLSLAGDATQVRISFRKGANATGAAYLDDIFVYNAGATGEWPGGWFNANMDAGDTWYYWWGDFDQGKPGWPETAEFVHTVTDEAAHTGTRSLKIEQNVATASEAVAISDRVPVVAGEPVLVSFWLKTEGVLHPDSIGTADYNLGLTALWYNQLASGAAGYGEIGGVDIRLNGDYNEMVIPLLKRQDAQGWTQYAFVVYPKEGAVGMELRLRYWHHFEGTAYFDDVAIVPLGGNVLLPTDVEDVAAGELPRAMSLRQNYPNPFNPSTTIAFDLPAAAEVTLEVYNLLGQRVALLVNDQRLSAGTHRVEFDGSGLSSGVYLYVLRSGHVREARTMVLLK